MQFVIRSHAAAAERRQTFVIMSIKCLRLMHFAGILHYGMCTHSSVGNLLRASRFLIMCSFSWIFIVIKDTEGLTRYISAALLLFMVEQSMVC